MEGTGKWALIRNTEDENKDKNLSKEMRAIARIFLSRYGVVFRKLLEREFCSSIERPCSGAQTFRA